MADTALHSMTANTAAAEADELYLLDDPAGTPADNRITYSNLMKISGLTEDTAPVRTTDYILSYDASGTVSAKVLLGRVSPYPVFMQSVSTSNDPADATSYYWGLEGGAWSSSAVNVLWYAPFACTIRKVDVLYVVAGTLATTETSTLYLRKNNTSDTTVTSSIALNATPYHELATLGTALTLAAGDTVQCKWTTPTWATNPTDVYPVIQVVVE